MKRKKERPIYQCAWILCSFSLWCFLHFIYRGVDILVIHIVAIASRAKYSKGWFCSRFVACYAAFFHGRNWEGFGRVMYLLN